MWLFQDNATLKIYVALMKLGKEVQKTELGWCGSAGESTMNQLGKVGQGQCITF